MSASSSPTGYPTGFQPNFPSLDPNYQTSGQPFSYTPPPGLPTTYPSQPPTSPSSFDLPHSHSYSPSSPSKPHHLGSHQLEPKRLDFSQRSFDVQQSSSTSATYMVYGTHGKMGGGTMTVSRQVDLTKSVVDLKVPEHVHPSYSAYGPVAPRDYGRGLGAALAYNTYVRTLRMVDARPHFDPSNFSGGQFNPGSKGAIEELGDALATNTTLTELDLNSKGKFRLSDHEIGVLMTALRGNQSVTSVDITAPPATTEFTDPLDARVKVDSIAHLLRDNEAIVRLSIANQGLSQGGLEIIAREMAKNTTLTTLDISESVLTGVDSASYPATLSNLLGLVGSSMETVMLSRQQVARLGFDGLLKALARRPNITSLSPSAGESWLPKQDTLRYVDNDTLARINPVYQQLNSFETQIDDGTACEDMTRSFSSFSPRDLLIERLNSYQFIYRSVCESILIRGLSPGERNAIYLKVWELSGRPIGDPMFGQTHAFTNWSIFFRAVEEAKLQSKFPFLF